MNTPDKNSYGIELIIDLYHCNSKLFKRRYLRRYFKQFCDLIDMQRGKLTWWDYFWTPWFWRSKDPNIYGTSAVQFILTSNITIHTLPKLDRAYINIFSCKDFDTELAADFTQRFFSGTAINKQTIVRQ